jgi:hypothetical protein
LENNILFHGLLMKNKWIHIWKHLIEFLAQ